jgi:AcrR family transcriptional regulator
VHRGHDRRDREGRHDDEGDASGVADVAGGSSAMRRELRTRIGTRWAHQGAQREPTKDALLQAAYRRVIDRVTERVTALLPAASARDFVRALLLELLPLDAEREAELRVGLAFTARSVVSPPLAELYAEGHRALVEALEGALRLAVAQGEAPPGIDVRREAVTAAALADGLAWHLLCAPGALTAQEVVGALDAHLDRLMPNAMRPGAEAS